MYLISYSLETLEPYGYYISITCSEQFLHPQFIHHNGFLLCKTKGFIIVMLYGYIYKFWALLIRFLY